MRLCVCLVPLLALASGCGGGHDIADKQLAEMRAEVTRLRAGQAALTERIDALEIERGAFGKGAAAPPSPDAPAPAPARPGDRDRPALDVVRLSPSDGDGDADSDGPRPLIRAVGSEGSIRKADRAAGARGAPKKGAVAPNPKRPDADPRPTPKP
jgi:hypothetical protein